MAETDIEIDTSHAEIVASDTGIMPFSWYDDTPIIASKSGNFSNFDTTKWFTPARGMYAVSSCSVKYTIGLAKPADIGSWEAVETSSTLSANGTHETAFTNKNIPSGSQCLVYLKKASLLPLSQDATYRVVVHDIS